MPRPGPLAVPADLTPIDGVSLERIRSEVDTYGVTEGSCCLRWTVEQISRQQDWRRHTITVGDSVEESMEHDESDLLASAVGPVLGQPLDHPSRIAEQERARDSGQPRIVQIMLH